MVVSSSVTRAPLARHYSGHYSSVASPPSNHARPGLYTLCARTAAGIRVGGVATAESITPGRSPLNLSCVRALIRLVSEMSGLMKASLFQVLTYG